ncbi:MAG: ester cyclase [Chloroflexia bacterium]
MPDSLMELHEVIVQGELAAYRWTASGAQPLARMPPTSKAMAMTGISLVRFERGKMAEVWHNYDTLGMLRQLGCCRAADRWRCKRASDGEGRDVHDAGLENPVLGVRVRSCETARESGGARWVNEFSVEPGVANRRSTSTGRAMSGSRSCAARRGT